MTDCVSISMVPTTNMMTSFSCKISSKTKEVLPPPREKKVTFPEMTSLHYHEPCGIATFGTSHSRNSSWLQKMLRWKTLMEMYRLFVWILIQSECHLVSERKCFPFRANLLLPYVFPPFSLDQWGKQSSKMYSYLQL